MSSDTVAQRLAQWVVAQRYEDLSPDTVFHTKRCLLDTLGVQVRGATLPWVQPAYEYGKGVRSDGGATVSYHGDRLVAEYAAYVNSTFAYSCELQHHGAHGTAHPGVIMMPVVEALGEELGSSGKDVLTAAAVGYEIQGRLGALMFEPLFKHHFHPQGVQGVFAATAAAGKLLGLSEEQLTHAFAIAGSHASAILEYDRAGGEVKRMHGAIAARSGMQSARLAKSGLTGPLTVFEGSNGVFQAYTGSSYDPELIFGNIGNPFTITQCRFRIYPCIGTSHNALDMMIDFLAAEPIDHHDIEEIRVGMSSDIMGHVTSITRPHDVISAQASVSFGLAALLVKGSVSLDWYIDSGLWQDPEVLSVIDKVKPYLLEDASHTFTTRLEVRLKDGRILEGRQDEPRGAASKPFPDEVMEDKFRGLTVPMLGADKAEQVIETVKSFDTLDSVAGFAQLLQKG